MLYIYTDLQKQMNKNGNIGAEKKLFTILIDRITIFTLSINLKISKGIRS